MKVSQPPLPCASMDSTKLAQVHQRLCGKWTGGAAQIWPWPPVQDSIARESERSATAKRAPYATARPYPTLPIYLRQKASPPSSLNILREISKKRKKKSGRHGKLLQTSANRLHHPIPSCLDSLASWAMWLRLMFLLLEQARAIPFVIHPEAHC